MRKILFFLLVAVSFSSCDWLEDQDTPICEDCYKAHYNTNTDELIEKTEESTLCGGDVIVWKNFDDETTDSITVKYECE
ncbi:MAG TPA: hypothetical protein DDX39_11175 [Bacteroidales bacterium]|nr:MAG: hypothetical protein A2W98_13770 [Bacteroidetes bacterium GWF2_33_38]OFY73273.1 MAG: hypothetical protein A2265_09285 [Bacteroidetes bacterium RIFOXYA12_FULL_33_9]OFY90978.1 MAG: hypothetical protein A2236_03405 [Bacteroidetes bacterium RIFOXYA2_FULL_33_7]HBF89193.1 hypothetical protein [Bacteroidales bacterium]